MNRSLLSFLAISLLVTTVSAQNPPFNVTKVSSLDYSSGYADIWAEGNIAFVAHSGQNRIDLIDISTPSSPSLISTYVASIPCSAQDVKTANGLMFAGLEQSGFGMEIVDIRNPASPTLLTVVNIAGYDDVHNSFYDNGWFYLANSRTSEVVIIDLRSYDPDNAPAQITSPTWRLTVVGNQIVHDVTVQDGRLYASGWDGIYVYDVTNVATQIPNLLGSAPGYNTHAAWATDDGRFVVTADERGGGSLWLYEMIDLGGSLDVKLRDTYNVPLSDSYSMHNVLCVGNRVYASYYQSGVHVLEIDPISQTWALVASYDTNAKAGTGNYDGCWGVYPFLGTDKVVASDRDNGLFVLDVDPNVLVFHYPGGPADTVPLLPGAPFQVRIQDVGSAVDTTSVALNVSIDGRPYQSFPMAHIGSNVFEASFPAANCFSKLDYYVSAQNLLAQSFSDPANAPATARRADSATGTTTILNDNFETNMGWSVQSDGSLTSGAWTRVNPRGTGPQPEDDNSASGDLCYVTEQGPSGGSVGTSDVDGGPTWLVSPTMDFSTGDGQISYSYWLFNNDDSDSMSVEVSNDNGANWSTVRTYSGLSGGWRNDSFLVSDHVTALTNQIVVRFGASDNPNDSVTEAAIDDVRAEVFQCSPTGLVHTVDPLFSNTNARFRTSGALPGEVVLQALSVFSGNGPCFFGGNLCLNLVGPGITSLGAFTADGFGMIEISLAIPPGAPQIDLFTQALVVRGVNGVDSMVSNLFTSPIL